MAAVTATTGNWLATTINGAACTTADDVTIPTGVTVTIPTATTAVCRSLTVASGGTLVFASTTAAVNIGDGTAGAGNVALAVVGNITLTGIGTILLRSTSATQQTVSCGGRTLPNVTFSGAGGSWILSDPFACSGLLAFTAGTLNTNNQTITSATFSVSSSNVRTLTLGSSAITVTAGATVISFATTTNLTMTANTATFLSTGNGQGNYGSFNFKGASITFTNASAGMSNPGTWANVTRTGTAATTNAFALSGNLTCTGTFTVTGNSVTNRMLVNASTLGTTITINAAAVSLTNVDFMDIALTGNVGAITTSDAFTRANGSISGSTTDLAAGGTGFVWGAPVNGTFSIASNILVPSYAPSTPIAAIPLAVGLANVRVSFAIKVLPSTGNGMIGIAVRYTDANNFIYMGVNQSGATNIGTMISGTAVFNSIANNQATALVANDVIGIEVNGYSVILYKNGVIYNSFILTNAQYTQLTGTSVAIVNTNTSAASVDDFNVWPINGWTGTSLGDCLGNSGITFTTAVTRTAVVAGNWSSTATWGGASVPLPQDDVIMDGSAGAGTYTIDMPRIGKNLDCTGFTRTLSTTLTTGGFSLYGSLTLASGMTWSVSSGNIQFRGRGSHTITTAGKTMADAGYGHSILAPGGTYTLTDAWVGSTACYFSILNGTFNTNGFSMSLFYLSTSGTATRAVTLGTSTITFNHSTAVCGLSFGGSNLTVSAVSTTFVYSVASTTTRTFAGGGFTYGTLTYNVANSPGTLTITGANYFENLNIGSGRTLGLPASTINTVNNFNANGAVNGYWRSAGATGNYALAPDSAPLSITGDIDIRVKVALDDWTPTVANTFVSKWTTTTSQSFLFQVNTTGFLTFAWSTTGANTVAANSTATVPASDGAIIWVRATLDVDNGAAGKTVAFYTSANGTSWTQLGTSVVSAGTTSIFDSATSLVINSYNLGATTNSTGNFYNVQVRNNILDNGTGIVFDADFTTKAVGANTFIESSVNAATVTITGDVAQAGDGRVQIISGTAATQASLAIQSAPPTITNQYVKDIFSVIPYKYYAGTTSANGGNNTNVLFSNNTFPTAPYIVKEGAGVSGSVNSTASFPFSQVATAGNLLVAIYTTSNNTGTMNIPPAGFTFIDSNITAGAFASSYVWYKVAVGGEATITTNTSVTGGGNIVLRLIEIAGFTGSPALDSSAKTIDGGVTAVSKITPTATNTLSPAIALAVWSMNGTVGNTVSITNNWHEERHSGAQTTTRVAAIPLDAVGSQSSTLTWTTTRTSAVQIVIFRADAAMMARMLSMMGVGS